MKYFSKGRLTGFARALAHAIYDKGIEKERTIYHYFDSDVVFRMVFGFEADRAALDPHDELIEALLSAGYLGYVHLIRPHAVELNELIRRHERDSMAVAGDYDKRVTQYLKTRFLRSNIDRLYESLQAPEDKKTAEFLTVLREVGAESFVAVELAADPWERRIRRLSGKVLRLHAPGDEMPSLLSDPETWRLYKLIGKERQRDVPVNNLSDAAALVSLGRLVAASSTSSRSPAVRFHTTSHAVLSLEDPAIHDALSYKVAPEWKMARQWDAGYIFRSTDYYLIRASFEALRFPDEEKKDALPPPISLADLDRVLEELTTAVTSASDKDTERELLKRVEAISVGQRTLIQVLLDIEHASFLDRLFSTDYRVPRSMRDVIEGTSAVLDFLKTGVPRQRLREGIARDALQLHETLRGDVPNLRQKVEFVDEVAEKVQQLFDTARRDNDFDIQKPLRDLGLVRWGGTITDADLRTTTTLVKQLFSEGDQNTAFAYLTAAIEERLDESRALSVCGVLWMLSLFERVIDVVNRTEDVVGILPLSLNIIRTAARVRTGHSFSHFEKKNHIDGLENLIREAGDPPRLYIGLAYATYYISRSNGEHLIAWSGQRIKGAVTELPWAARSFQFAEKAVLLAGRDSLARAFAVNHCAYVGMQMNIFGDRTKKYLEDLEGFRDNEEVWHYRFADTLAVKRYRAAYQRWEELLAAPTEAAVLRPKICSFLIIALRILEGAHPYFGDPEIPQHVDEIKLLQKKADCLDGAAT